MKREDIEAEAARLFEVWASAQGLPARFSLLGEVMRVAWFDVAEASIGARADVTAEAMRDGWRRTQHLPEPRISLDPEREEAIAIGIVAMKHGYPHVALTEEQREEALAAGRRARAACGEPTPETPTDPDIEDDPDAPFAPIALGGTVEGTIARLPADVAEAVRVNRVRRDDDAARRFGIDADSERRLVDFLSETAPPVEKRKLTPPEPASG